jgi:serine/threonine protein kinase
VPVAPLRPGDPKVVGPHRLLGRLGQGGMGTVFLGVSPDERAVAVKVLRDAVGDAEARRRFRHELAALRKVRGPHLVEVLDADVDAETPYLVTRFVPGRRLDELVAEDGPLQDEALHDVARGIADALATLHRAGVVHRDLTPGNVLVLDGSPQVIDLGLATAADVTAMTRSGLVVGTPGYLAPEQVTGRLVTAAADVHAWGATVALAATGRPPYGTGRPEAVLYRIVHDDPDLDGVPLELLRLVEAAMAHDPGRRPAAADLLARLGGASHEETVTVHLPRDVDATTVLSPGALRPRPTAVLTAVAPREEPRYEEPPYEAPYEPPYEPPYEEAYEPAHDEHDPVPWDEQPEPRPSSTRSAQVLLTGTAVLAVVATGALVAPVVTAAVVLAAVVLLRAGARSSDKLALRRERRGDRRRDPVVAALGAPWHLLAALADLLVSLPLIAVLAGVPAGLVYLLDPTFNGLEGPELTASTATVLGLVVWLARRGNRRSRRALRSMLVTATPSTASAVAVVAVLAASAVLLLATAEGSAPTWWPATQLR